MYSVPVEYNVVSRGPVTVELGSPQVIDLRGCMGFTIMLDGGTATYEFCDTEGNAIPGVSPVAAVHATRIEVSWPYIYVVAFTADCVLAGY